MARDDRQMTFIVVPHGRDATTRSFELPYRRLKLLVLAAAGVGLLVLVMAGSWLWLAAQASQVPGLRAEVRQLRQDRARVEELARMVGQLNAEYTKVRAMLGVDSISLPAIVDSAAAGEPAADTTDEDDAAGPQASLPRRWPLGARGYVTRGHQARADGSHPGMDIAVASGSPILAWGGGVVTEVGEDSVYGRYVRLAHEDGYESLYAHASSLLVQARQRVPAGEVIALSGSTGASTAPHLHFEIRKDGRPVDPGTLVPNPN